MKRLVYFLAATVLVSIAAIVSHLLKQPHQEPIYTHW